MDGMSMGGMSDDGGMMMMGGGGISFDYLQKMFWAVVGAAIGTATLVNVLNHIVCWQRLRAARMNQPTPAKPKSAFFTAFATLTAISREVTNSSWLITTNRSWRSPTTGRVTMILAELVTVIVLCFYGQDTTDQWQWESVAYQVGHIAAAQLPLIVLLAGKNNIIGFLTGSSYERLNWLHRWTARILFLTVTIHMAFWFRDWGRWHYIIPKLRTDKITQRGFASWCILLWIILSSFAPIRKWNYSLFVIQHIVTFIGFLVAAYLHLPSDMKVWVWLPIAFYVFDRTVRTLFLVFTNIAIFHLRVQRKGLLSCTATIEPIEDDHTRIVIERPPITWRPGQHVLLACHGISPFKSHPFTIASIPQDGRMEFVVKSKAGSTRRFLDFARKNQTLPSSGDDCVQTRTTSVVIDGPYGRIRDLRQYDSVFLVAGSNGATFAIPLLRDIVESWKASSSMTPSQSRRRVPFLGSPSNAATRHIRFVWVVKSYLQVNWFSIQLAQTLKDVQHLRQEMGQNVELEIAIYMTCSVDPVGNSACQVQSKQKRINLSDSSRTDSSLGGETVYYKPEEISSSSSSSSNNFALDVTEKPKQATNISTKIRPISSTTTANPFSSIEPSISEKQESSPPSKCCCCSTTTATATNPSKESEQNPCKCHVSSSAAASSPYTLQPLTTASNQYPPLPPQNQNHYFQTRTGRPPIPTLLTDTLEQAMGETAVVACGPTGLVTDVRQTVVRISDDRAVCKGTGALGVWFWGEAFELL